MVKQLIKAGFIASISAAALFSASDKEITDFVTKMVKSNPAVSVKTIKILSKEKVPNSDGWEAVKVLMDLSIDRGGKASEMKTSDMFFAKGNLLAPDLFELKKGTNYKQLLSPKITAKYYTDEQLVAGNKNAKNKIVVFSDPLCPYCKEFLPDAVAYAQKNPSEIVVYHYSFPLTSIHPASPTLVKAAMALEKMGTKDALVIVYTAKDIPVAESDEEKVLAKLNEALGTKLTKADINKKEILAALDKEIDIGYEMMVRSTPSVYINGELDSGKTKYTEITKNLKK